MKSLTKAIAIASLATVSAAAQAELSATVGLVSDYVYRGVDLGGAGAYFSVDFETAGFYAGAWTIDDGGTVDGLETDYYFGYGFEQDEFSAGIGYTRYEYSYAADFEQEIALSVGFAGFGLEYVHGESEDEVVGASAAEQDYDIITLSWAGEVFGVTLAQASWDDFDGSLGGEFEYNYVEFSASKEVSGFDVTATLGKVFGAECDSGVTGCSAVTTSPADVSSYGSDYLTVDISKSFDL